MKSFAPILAIFVLSIYCYINYSASLLEGFGNENCPNLLIQKGNKIYLQNTKKALVPGVNPIVFNNLEEYVEYIEWQKAYNIECPVLFLKREYDAQNQEVYKLRPDILETNGGGQGNAAGKDLVRREMDLNNKGQNIKSELLTSPFDPIDKSPFDPMDQSQGDNSGLDKMFNEQEQNNTTSDNPMDANWGGTGYTQQQIDSGKYKGSEVAIYIP